MAAAFTGQQAREALALPVTEAVTEVCGPGPKIYPRNCLHYKLDKEGKPDFSEWPGMFTYGDAGEFIHGWVIKRTSRLVSLRNAGCQDLDLSFDIWGFFKFAVDSREVSPGVFLSSDDEFENVVDAVADRFNTNPLLTINGKTVRHEGLQFPALTPLRAGQHLLLFAGGSIQLLYP